MLAEGGIKIKTVAKRNAPTYESELLDLPRFGYELLMPEHNEYVTDLGRGETENYPDLKANENFRDLQAQLEGTENRIATERGRYSELVAGYNAKIRKFPAVITAKIFGFEAKPQFAAETGAEKAPVVEF